MHFLKTQRLSFSRGRKTFWKWTFLRTLTWQYSCNYPAQVFLKHKSTDRCLLRFEIPPTWCGWKTFDTFSEWNLCFRLTPWSVNGALVQGKKTKFFHVRELCVLKTRNSVHYSCPRLWYPVWMCNEYKDFNCWEINVWSLLLIFKCCKILLEDGEARRRRNKRELVEARPSNACALAKILPETTVRA